nr:MAG TPA: hypothetical protein [Ackermannviridae sp.]
MEVREMKAFKTYELNKCNKTLKEVSADFIQKFISKFNDYELLSELYKKEFSILCFNNGLTIVIRENKDCFKIDFSRVYFK